MKKSFRNVFLLYCFLLLLSCAPNWNNIRGNYPLPEIPLEEVASLDDCLFAKFSNQGEHMLTTTCDRGKFLYFSSPIYVYDFTSTGYSQSNRIETSEVFIPRFNISGDGKKVAFSKIKGVSLFSKGHCTIILIDTESGYRKHIDGGRDIFLSLAFSPDNNTLAGGSDNGEVVFWSVHTGRKIKRKKLLDSNVTALAFSSDGRILVAGGEDGKIALWNMEDDKVRKISGFREEIASLLISPDHNFLAVSERYEDIVLYDLRNDITKKRFKVLANATFSQSPFVFNSDSSKFFFLADRTHIIEWNMKYNRGEKIFYSPISKAGILAVTINPSGSLIAYQSVLGKIFRMNLLSEVYVNTTPQGAEVFIDGKYRGISPISLRNISSGTHTIEGILKKSNKNRLYGSTSIRIGSGESKNVLLNLEEEHLLRGIWVKRENLLESLLSWAQSLENSGKYIRAIEEYSEILSIEPENIDAKNGIARIINTQKEKILNAIQSGEIENAEVALKILKDIAEKLPDRKINVTELEEKLQEAKTIKEEQEKINDLLTKAEEAENAAETAKAIKIYIEVLGIDPDNTIAKEKIEKLEKVLKEKIEKYIDEGNIENAEEVLNTYKELVEVLPEVEQTVKDYEETLKNKRGIVVINSGFENDLDGWKIKNQAGDCVFIDSNIFHTGSKSLKLIMKAWGGSAIQDIPISSINPDSLVNVELWLLMPKPGSRSNKWFTIALIALDKGGNRLAANSKNIFGPYSTWTKESVSLRVPQNTAVLRIWIHTSNGNGCCGPDPLWVDDVTIKIEPFAKNENVAPHKQFAKEKFIEFNNRIKPLLKNISIVKDDEFKDNQCSSRDELLVGLWKWFEEFPFLQIDEKLIFDSVDKIEPCAMVFTRGRKYLAPRILSLLGFNLFPTYYIFSNNYFDKFTSIHPDLKPFLDKEEEIENDDRIIYWGNYHDEGMYILKSNEIQDLCFDTLFKREDHFDETTSIFYKIIYEFNKLFPSDIKKNATIVRGIELDKNTENILLSSKIYDKLNDNKKSNLLWRLVFLRDGNNCSFIRAETDEFGHSIRKPIKYFFSVKSSKVTIPPFAENWWWSKKRNQDGRFAEAWLYIALPSNSSIKKAVLHFTPKYSQQEGIAFGRVYLNTSSQVVTKDEDHISEGYKYGNHLKDLTTMIGKFSCNYKDKKEYTIDITKFLKAHRSDIYYVSFENLNYADIGIEDIFIEIKRKRYRVPHDLPQFLIDMRK